MIASLKTTAKACATVGAAAALVLSVTSSASANGLVQWRHDVSGKCLAQDYYDTDVWLATCDAREAKWYDYANNDGTWLMQDYYTKEWCLTGYGNDVYIEKCTGNDWQRWSENWTGSAWKLKNKATGRFLDSNGGNGPANVYLHDENDGRYQLWH
ncbi:MULTISPECIES: hypothetical protein [unclassified Streptomyces]|uniref:RICIN domain-containing protein n=1 Tax=unclassified Streptomyces TaxID=2593676 RepID=UPI002E144E22|nr:MULTISPECIES: hypothetical protein [unclassified Streptomyces]WSR28959.1 hypothetical protein OG573_40895 [Streptomyces sp. NBC_01205]